MKTENELPFDKLQSKFIEELRKLVELSDDACCRISASQIEIGVTDTDEKSSYFGRMAFASAVTVYAENETYERESEINFGSSGAFTPKNTASYWRVIHAANILKNWSKVCELVNDFCYKYKELVSGT